MRSREDIWGPEVWGGGFGGGRRWVEGCRMGGYDLIDGVAL